MRRSCPTGELRPLEPAERDGGRGVHRRLHPARQPDPRLPGADADGRKLRELGRHAAVKALTTATTTTCGPGWFVTNHVRKRIRRSAAERLYEPLDESSRPFVYFPLHLTNDYKIRRVVPHCEHQDAIVEQVAAALPQGHDLVLKEHPLSIGWNPVGMLRRLARARQHPARPPAHEQPRADPPLGGGGRDRLDRRPRGAPLREARDDDRAALLLGLRDHARRGQPARAARGGPGAARLPARARAHPLASSTPPCTAACPGSRCSWTTPTRTRWRSRTRSPSVNGLRR